MDSHSTHLIATVRSWSSQSPSASATSSIPKRNQRPRRMVGLTGATAAAASSEDASKIFTENRLIVRGKRREFEEPSNCCQSVSCCDETKRSNIKGCSNCFRRQECLSAYIEAAEIMLKDDVASNKAIGSYGASFLQRQLEDPTTLSILTHCNTGSLATAGYGAARGVIRALQVFILKEF